MAIRTQPSSTVPEAHEGHAQALVMDMRQCYGRVSGFNVRGVAGRSQLVYLRTVVG